MSKEYSGSEINKGQKDQKIRSDSDTILVNIDDSPTVSFSTAHVKDKKPSSNSRKKNNVQQTKSKQQESGKHDQYSISLPFKIHGDVTDGSHGTSEGELPSTNAYGHVVFVGGEKTFYAKYLRLMDQTDFNKQHETSNVGERLKKLFHISDQPRLIVSVNGGLLEDTSLKQGGKEIFQKDLEKFCQTVAGSKKETLFITSGFDTEIITMLEDAMRLHKNEGINIIGIMNWKTVQHKDRLIQRPDGVKVPKYPVVLSEVKLNAEPTTEANHLGEDQDSDDEDDEDDEDDYENFKEEEEENLLNKNHSHFLFVDNPGKARADNEINFRTRFEEYLIKTEKVPSVQIMMNGGMKSMLQMKANLRWDTRSDDPPSQPLMPIVVVKDSGRLSSCLVRAMEIFDNTQHQQKEVERQQTNPNNKDLKKKEEEEEKEKEGDGRRVLPLLLDTDENEAAAPLPLFDEQDEENHKISTSSDEDKADALRQYVHKQFECFYYRSTNRTIKYTDEQRNSIFEFVKECATNSRIRQSIFVYDVYKKSREISSSTAVTPSSTRLTNKGDSSEDGALLNTIVDAILQSYRQSIATKSSIDAEEGEETRQSRQTNYPYYRLMMQWDSCEVFHQYVDELFAKKDTAALTCVVREALKLDKPKFLDYILDKGYNVQLIDWTQITVLYLEILKSSEEIAQMLIPKKFLKKYINFKDLENKDLKRIYKEDEIAFMPKIKALINDLISAKICHYKEHKKKIGENSPCLDPDAYKPQNDYKPFKELFIWSIVCNKQKMANYLKTRGENFIAKLLIGCRMFQSSKKLYKTRVEKNRDIIHRLDQKVIDYENEAIEILDVCSSVDKKMAGELVITRLPQYGKRTLMELAALSEREKFISNNRCKRAVDKIWRNKIVIQDGDWLNIMVFFSIFLFPLVPFFVDIGDSNDSCGGKTREQSGCKRKSLKTRIRNWWKKILFFFQAPVTKFWTNNISFVLFVGFFVYMVMNPYERWPRKSEWGLFAYVGALSMEEIRQILLEQGLSLYQKGNRWWQNNWNKIDLAACVLFFVAFAMRLWIPYDSPNFEYCRFVYAVDIFLWIFRLLELFTLHQRIGTYIIMLLKMMKDVFSMVVIFVILVLAWGTARFSILYPDNKFNFFDGTSTNQVFKKMFLVPSFQIFGEIFIDSVETAQKENKTVFQTDHYVDHSGILQPGSESFGIIFTFIYMVLTNILMLNLLIAKFNYTYAEIDSQSVQIWHWYNFVFVQEHVRRSVLPIPFSIFGHLKAVIFYGWQRYQKHKLENQQQKKVKSTLRKKKYKGLNKYFSKYESYLHILSHENDCYTMWSTRKKLELERSANSEQDEILKKIRETLLSQKKENLQSKKKEE